ncbi:MAG: hypothetical protein ABR579_01270 [Actinomycetota bacterium]
MSADTGATQPIESAGADSRSAGVYDPSAYVVQGSAILPRHKRSPEEPVVVRAEVQSAAEEPVATPPLTAEPSLPERIAETIAAEVAAETAEPVQVVVLEEVDPAGAAEPSDAAPADADTSEPHRLVTRGPRRVNEGAHYRGREFEAVHAERRASMTRRTQILASGVAGVAALLGGGAVASGLAHSRSILVGIFCFGAPLFLQLIVSAWLEESIRAVRAQDYLIALESTINEHLEHRSVGFESWLRRPHSRLELPFRWVADFAAVLSVATAFIGWESAHLSGVDFLWAVGVPIVLAGAGRYWAEQTLNHLHTESRRRLRLEP